MNLYLFQKYWSKHKKRLFSLILSIIILTSTAVFSVLNERSSLRNRLHKLYNINGNYALAVLNVTEQQENEIRRLPYLNKIGRISSVGKVEIADSNYTIGCFENREAEVLYHTPMLRGKIPEKNGQVAIPEFILNMISPDSDIGDQITLNYYNSNKEYISGSYIISGIIDNYTNRHDMEYTCMSDGMTITSKEIAFPEPSIFIYPDNNINKDYINLLISADDNIYFSEEYINYDKSIEELYSNITDNIVSGGQKFVLDSMSDMEYTSEGFLQTQKTNDIKITNIITTLLMMIAAISSISGIVSIMPQRIQSLQLLRTIGFSRNKLLNIFFTESMIFLFTGTFLGIVFACGIHELFIFIQNAIGLTIYRGYTAEYIIEQKTHSPFILPVILSSGIIILSLIVPVKSIFSMTSGKSLSKKKKKHVASNSIKSVYSKITGTKFVAFILSLSVIIVIFSTVLGYCYYSQSDKGTSYLSIGNENTEESYYLVKGINLKKNKMDCFISAEIPCGNTLAVFENKYGVSAEEEKKLEHNAEVLSWGMYPAYTVIYDKEEAPDPLSQNIVKLNPDWEYYDSFSQKYFYDLPLILMNENMISKLCDANNDDVILISQNAKFAYEIGDSISMYTCYCDKNSHVMLNTLQNINVTVTKQFNLKELETNEDSIIQSCGVLNFPIQYGIVMTAKKAKQLGFYNPDYSSVTMKFSMDLDDSEIYDYISECINKPVRIITINQLIHSAKIKKLSSSANSIVLFALMFVLLIITLYNLLQMNISNNLDNFSIMHSLGMSFKQIKRIFIYNILLYISISIFVGIIISFVGQSYISAKYQTYTDLLSKQQELAGNDAYPDVIIGFSADEFDETDELYEITNKLDDLKSKYMLEKELWLPDLYIPLFLICMIILISTLLCSLIVSGTIKSERRYVDDKN